MRPDDLELVFSDDFGGPDLDLSVWLPHYLPAWSSRAQSAAVYDLADSCLRLSIPPDQGLWCAGDHEPPLRVSGIQSGNFSGPVGSSIGQAPYRDGLRVREEQLPFRGWLPEFGYIEMRARMDISPRSMAGFWMAGFEDRPERSGEILLFEVFGNAVDPGTSAEVGMGLRSFHDPAVIGDFAAVRVPIDVSEFHTYAVDWNPARADLLIDGAVWRSLPAPPAYPLQMMVAVFDFPEDSRGDDDDLVPALVVDYLRGYRH